MSMYTKAAFKATSLGYVVARVPKAIARSAKTLAQGAVRHVRRAKCDVVAGVHAARYEHTPH